MLSDLSVVYSTEGDSFLQDRFLRRLYHINGGSCKMNCVNWRPLVALVAGHDLDVPLQQPADYDLQEVIERAGYRTADLMTSEKCWDVSRGRVSCEWRTEWLDWTTPCFTADMVREDRRVSRLQVLVNTKRLLSAATVHNWPLSVYAYFNHNREHKLENGSRYTFRSNKVTRTVRLGPPYQHCGLVSTWQCHSQRHSPWDDSHRCSAAWETIARWNFSEACREVCYRGSGTADHPHGCPVPSCDAWRFQTSSTTQEKRLGPHALVVGLMQGEDVDMTTYQEVAFYPLESLLAEIGGTMGLFVGISLLTILHCCRFVLGEVALCVRAAWAGLGDKTKDPTCVDPEE